MTNQPQRRLGRGLEALLGQPFDSMNNTQSLDLPPIDGGQVSFDDASAAAPGNGLLHISVNLIDPNRFQPRTEFDEAELETLAESIRQHGVIQPIVVRSMGDRYELISGERRLRASIKAGWLEVPCLVREADDRQVAEVAIVENVQRKDLNPLEKAASFQRYLEQYACTQEELAQRIQLDRSTIANLIRLLELPDDVQHAIRGGAISQGHARALLPLGDEQDQRAFCQRIIDEQLSVRAVEDLVRETLNHGEQETPVVAGTVGPAGAPSKKRKPRSQHTASLEQELRIALGTKVEIRQNGRGRGKLMIHFSSNEEFERLRGQLTGRTWGQSATG